MRVRLRLHRGAERRGDEIAERNAVGVDRALKIVAPPALHSAHFDDVPDGLCIEAILFRGFVEFAAVAADLLRLGVGVLDLLDEAGKLFLLLVVEVAVVTDRRLGRAIVLTVRRNALAA